MTWWILLTVPAAVACERVLDADARRVFRAWLRLRRIKSQPRAPVQRTHGEHAEQLWLDQRRYDRAGLHSEGPLALSAQGIDVAARRSAM